MKTSMKVAVSCYALIGAIGLFMTARYWTAEQFMPYHVIVSGGPWDSLTAGVQRMVLAMLKVMSAGFFGMSVAILALIVPVARGDTWARWTSLATSCALLIPLVYITVSMQLSTGAPAPVVPSVIGLVLAVGAFVAAEIATRGRVVHGSLEPRGADL